VTIQDAPATTSTSRRQSAADFIHVRGVSKSYRARDGAPVAAVDNITLDIAAGDFVSIVGPSGCGKSTLLAMVAGLIPSTHGEVRIDGRTVSEPYTKVGIVFQNDLLLDWRTVLGNVLFQLEMRGEHPRAFEARARELIASVGLAGFERKHPFELSGGMRQRVALCRALVHDPPLLLMDEPFGALDALTRDQLQVDLQRIWQESRKTVLFVTHSIAEAVFLSDRVVVMTPRPGRIREVLSIDLQRPRDLDVRESPAFAQYVHRVNRLFRQMGVLHG
jgi:NitT/TauT family transport system ATP-binding protein